MNLHYFICLLKGTSKVSGSWTFTKSLGCCCCDGSCSFLQSTGVTSSRPDSPSSPPSSPSSSPTGNSPQSAEACPGAHPHHTRANPFYSLLMTKQDKAHCEDEPCIFVPSGVSPICGTVTGIMTLYSDLSKFVLA